MARPKGKNTEKVSVTIPTGIHERAEEYLCAHPWMDRSGLYARALHELLDRVMEPLDSLKAPSKENLHAANVQGG